MEIAVKISLFYKNVTVLDYAFLDDHRGVVGDALNVDVEFVGETDHEGVVFDFSHAKKKVKEIIDRDCDHRLVAPASIVETHDGISKLEFTYGHAEEKITYECPEEGICLLPFSYVSKANIQTYLETIILKEMPKTVKAVKIKLRDERFGEDKPYFHYTHGLKQHYGNCQRLFHGHKNTVDVFINGQETFEFEEWLAKDLFNHSVHFCLWENVVNKDEIENVIKDKTPEGRYPELPEVKISYEANQGKFSGTLPGRAVYFLQDETTVENLSIHFAHLVKSQVGEHDNVIVHAYEGIAKGAITSL